ncbi:MAG: RNA 2',3'-cyclic phosphodiesterase [Pontiellaceae bacterium]|nr:RNA 2',3'-cyclic phosphodiesterase [Pontiellaceae bacterium]MBN2785737.1 RNA 2',3'-cyclic phosphodiesterase [Pontiellaceae bacterium]
MKTVRAFIAAEIGADLREKLTDLQRKLKQVEADVRWITPDGIHLTLAFLGNIPEDRINAVSEAIDRAGAGHTRFDFAVCGTGYFGSTRHPRIIWAGVADSPPLLRLQRQILRELQQSGIAFDNKPFSPHLTLGRIKRVDRNTEALLQEVNERSSVDLGMSTISHVDLIQSTPKPTGAEYCLLHRMQLV